MCVWRWVIKLNREVITGVVEMVTFDQDLKDRKLALPTVSQQEGQNDRSGVRKQQQSRRGG